MREELGVSQDLIEKVEQLFFPLQVLLMTLAIDGCDKGADALRVAGVNDEDTIRLIQDDGAEESSNCHNSTNVEGENGSFRPETRRDEIREDLKRHSMPLGTVSQRIDLVIINLFLD